jgi:hypothetical protein
MMQVDAFAWTICCPNTMMVQKWDNDIYWMKSHENEQQYRTMQRGGVHVRLQYTGDRIEKTQWGSKGEGIDWGDKQEKMKA